MAFNIKETFFGQLEAVASGMGLSGPDMGRQGRGAGSDPLHRIATRQAERWKPGGPWGRARR